MRKHKFNRPLTIAFTVKMYGEIKKSSDRKDVSMAQWIRESLGKIIAEDADELEAMLADKLKKDVPPE